MTVKVNEIIKKKRVEKISNGVNIFNKMKSELKKSPEATKFILDFDGIEVCSVFVFKEIIRQMQTQLDGKYELELVNAKPILQQSFKMALR